jgi:hypothetical protein
MENVVDVFKNALKDGDEVTLYFSSHKRAKVRINNEYKTDIIVSGKSNTVSGAFFEVIHFLNKNNKFENFLIEFKREGILQKFQFDEKIRMNNNVNVDEKFIEEDEFVRYRQDGKKIETIRYINISDYIMNVFKNYSDSKIVF